MGIKINPNEVSELIEKYNDFDEQIEKFEKNLGTEQKYIRQIRDTYATLKSKKIDEAFGSIPIEDINCGNSNLNTEALRNLGYTSVAKLTRITDSDISAYRMKNYTSSKKMQEISRQLYNKFSFKLSSENIAYEAPFKTALYCYNASKHLKKELKKFKDKYRDNILYDLDALKEYSSKLKKSGRLKLFFMSNEDKSRISNLQESLNAKYNEICANKFQELKNLSSDLEQNNLNEIACKAFKNNPDEFLQTAQEFVINFRNEDIDTNEKVGEDATYICKIHETLSNQNQELLIGLTETLPEEIKKAVYEIKKQKALQALKQISIEELNRNKTGLTLKPLQDNGYNTIYDVHTTSAHQLASIRGISQANANKIKNIAYGIFEATDKSAKIKINSDKKDNNTTELISKIDAMKNLDNSRDLIKKIHSFYSNTGDELVRELSFAKNKATWLLASEEEKKNVLQKYNFLKEQLNTNEFKDFRQLVSSPMTDKTDVWSKFENNPISYYNILEKLVPDALGNEGQTGWLSRELEEEIRKQQFSEKGLSCDLRNYQKLGVKYILHQKRVLLGDEMGLGKTIQAIATMVALSNMGETHFIVVCPASVLTNWCREISKFSTLDVLKVHGNNKKLALDYWVYSGGVAVTTYEATKNFNITLNYSLCVVDEAHYIKNETAIRSISVRKLCQKADRLLFMTGTALENKVSEMISLITILNPKIAATIKGMTSLSAAEQFREEISPVYFRRKRDDVLTELPELIEQEEWLSLNAEEERAYSNSLLEKNYAKIRRVSWNITDISRSSKANRTLELIDTAKSEGRKVIIFSFFLDTIDALSKLLGKQALSAITGKISPSARQKIIDKFDDAPAGTVLLSQIQSGGTGLNIQSASVIILCEPQFKPSIENQAIARAYRMGQARNVLVYRLLCENTVDEKIIGMLNKKQELFDTFADKSISANNINDTEIDTQSFKDIVDEEIRRLKDKRGEK